ncbi:glycosyltransferase family 39 protein [Candidatus Woesebacteria bacterium]|nr:glycosyltransferase family 39 protein [Candidatus Woesebacteria bacterium]
MIKKSFLILAIILLVASVLRLWRLDQVPVSLFGDELDLGYQAYSILKTGKDYSGNFMPVHFHSLAEWRTPLYLYSSVPTVAIFGISPYGVRLPAAIFGILGVLAMYLLVKEITKKEDLAQVSAFVMALNPWHIQYSRAGFEVTELLFFLLLGLFFFFKSFEKGKWLWVSALCFALLPWVYSTAKLFTPLLLGFLVIVWRKEIFKLSRKHLIYAAISLIVVGSPIALSTLFGGGAQRFGYISIFTDPTTEPEVGFARLNDAKVRGEEGAGLKPTFTDRLFHNKFTFWGGNIVKNYFGPFSTDFLFVRGDINLRHSIGIGEFYKVESIALVLGLIFFFVSGLDRKIKALLIFWILVGVVPSVITRDGATHATRLILILPPLIFLISFGLAYLNNKLSGLNRKLFLFLYSFVFIVSFIFYQHDYWFHYPWNSERWWHAGFRESIQTIKQIDQNYDKVVISTSNEPPWLFFAAWYEFPPDKWQTENPIGHDVEVKGFGKISNTGKFYFGTPDPKITIYGLGNVIDKKTLYLAVAKEMGANLILEPSRVPAGLKMIKAVAYPSGEPAFYLLAGTK